MLFVSRHNADYIVDKLVKELRLAHASDQVENYFSCFLLFKKKNKQTNKQKLVQLAAVHGILRHSPTNATWLVSQKILGVGNRN